MSCSSIDTSLLCHFISGPRLLSCCTVQCTTLTSQKLPPQRNLIALFRSCCVLPRSGSCRTISAACCSISATLTQPQLWQTGDLLSPLRTSPTYHVPRCTGRAYVAMLLCSCSQFPSARSLARSLSQSVHSSFSPYVPSWNKRSHLRPVIHRSDVLLSNCMYYVQRHLRLRKRCIHFPHRCICVLAPLWCSAQLQTTEPPC